MVARITSRLQAGGQWYLESIFTWWRAATCLFARLSSCSKSRSAAKADEGSSSANGKQEAAERLSLKRIQYKCASVVHPFLVPHEPSKCPGRLSLPPLSPPYARLKVRQPSTFCYLLHSLPLSS
ncbi:hypothetical protein PGT21_033527 [Puccinia graminis f. sp. tritici]|uniref:Uncharacterized protein n=1 Tax=Puccinia graminis f. sp. tritici TaxID=56615 RepID=A0A5B0QY20_PUCGR|nr:hypothetical protein PGT21_033527 [Puccinia graminis f. sp. tritici]